MRKQTLMTLGFVCAALLAPLALRTSLAQTIAAVPAAVGASAGASAPASTSASATANESARVIVKYKVDSSLLPRKTIQSASAEQARVQRASQAQALGLRIGIPLAAGIGIADRSHVVLASGITSAQLAQRLSGEGDIEYAVPDVLRHHASIPNDPYYASRPYDNAATPRAGGPVVGQWYLKPPGPATAAPTANTPNTAPAAIDAQGAWDITTGNSSIVVAVLDTGIRFDHADLKTVANGGNLLPGYDMISDAAIANDGDGRDADASDPGDFITLAEANQVGGRFYGGSPTNCTSPDPNNPGKYLGENSSWHGTETAGLIGAVTDNGAGIASVGRNVKVLPVRVLGKCGGYDSDIIAGMRWAAGLDVPGVPANANNKARVINMSLGGSGACSQAYIDAVAQVNAAGTVVVAAAGNSAGHAVGTPADCAGVIGVGGLRHVGTKVGFSDLGPEIAISAPAGNCLNNTAGAPCLYPILTTSNPGATAPVPGAAGSIYSDSFQRAALGTSFSAPLVSGTVALMLSVQPALTPAQVKSQLQTSSNPFPTTGGTISAVVTTASPAPLLPVTLSAAEPAQCTAPSAADQVECYCTTSTCGAGMLDAYSAVSAAAGTAAAPTVPGMRRTVAYQWTLVDGGGIVTALAGANTPSVSTTPTAAGSFKVSLATTDDLGVVSTTTTTVTVAAPTPPPSPSDSGGGGALGVGWLLLLLAAIVALCVVPPPAKRPGRQTAKLHSTA